MEVWFEGQERTFQVSYPRFLYLYIWQLFIGIHVFFVWYIYFYFFATFVLFWIATLVIPSSVTYSVSVVTTLLLLASYLFRNHYKILSTKWVNSTEGIFLIFRVKARPELLRNTIQLLITREFSLQLSRLQAISDYWFYSPSTEIEFSIPNGLSTEDIK